MAKTSIYGQLLQAQIRSTVSYRTSFFLECAAEMSVQFKAVMPVLVVFSQVTSLGGFTQPQILLMYAFTTISFGFSYAVFGKLDDLPEYLLTGKLDTLLIRPLSTLGQLLTSEFRLYAFGRIAASFAIFGYAILNVNIQWRITTVLLTLLAFLSGITIISSLWVIANSTVFWTIAENDIVHLNTYGLTTLTSQPITIYPNWLRIIFCFIIPGAFITYYPTLAILDKPDPLGGPAYLAWIAPGIALLTACAAAAVWRLGIRHYRGAGS